MKINGSKFRELNQEPFWGGNISVSTKNIEKVKEAIDKVCQELSENCFGYFIYNPQTILYHLSKYPRWKYGPPQKDATLNRILSEIGHRVGQKPEIEQFKQRSAFRILLCFREGYMGTKIHNISEVKKLLGRDYRDYEITLAKIYALRPNDGRIIKYEEKGFLVSGGLKNINQIYLLAEKFKQERFTVENFWSLTVHIVETMFCSTPDNR